MTAGPGFDLDLPTPAASAAGPVAPAVEEKPASARDMVAALTRHYTGGEGHRDEDSHAVYCETPHGPDGTGRRIDLLAVSLWGSRGIRLEGHEIKVSRADWLSELAKPSKAEGWWSLCHRWWLVVPHESIVADGELPDGWGLMVPEGRKDRRKLRVVHDVPIRTPETPAWLLGRLLLTDKRQQRRLLEDAKYRARLDGLQRGREQAASETSRGQLTLAQRGALDAMAHLRDVCEKAGHTLDLDYSNFTADSLSAEELAQAVAIALTRRRDPSKDRYTADTLRHAADRAEQFARLAREAADMQKQVTV